MKKEKIWGISLIVSGITVAIALLVIFWQGLYMQKWLPIASAGYWDTFWDYYWEIGKTNTILCLLAGMIPAGMGTYLLIRKRKA